MHLWHLWRCWQRQLIGKPAANLLPNGPCQGGSTLSVYRTGIVLGMALLAAAVGGLCFVLGRRSAHAPALTTAAAAAGDIEVRRLAEAAAFDCR